MTKPKKKDEQIVHIDLPPGETKLERLQKLYDKWFKCTRCHLHEFRCTADGEPFDDIVFCTGSPDADIMIVGEAPGEEEANTLVPFVGKSGKLLNQILASVTSDTEIRNEYVRFLKTRHSQASEDRFQQRMFDWRENHFFITNVIGCRPPENRTPIPPEVRACSDRLLNLIYLVDPTIIIASGKTAIETLLNKKVEITMKRGEMYEMTIKGKLTDVTYPVIATLHPSYLLRKADWNDPRGEYSKTVQDFMNAMRLYDFLQETHKGIPPPQRGIG